MNIKTEMISVILTAYNHEKFIRESIGSILEQSHQNFELIVVDDGSTDATREIINEIKDDRMKLIFKFNEGPSVAVNTAVRYARSNWVALMSGDDVAERNRLEVQLNAARTNNSDFVFSKPELINESGIVMNDGMFPFFFGEMPLHNDLVFKKLFYDGNFICAPTTFMKKECYQELGGFIETSLQLQDYALWIEAAKRYKIKILENRLIKYRIHSNNLSGVDKSNRIIFENIQVYRKFFDNVNWDMMKSLFSEISFYSKEDDELFELEKSLIFINHKDPVVRMIGAERLYEQMSHRNLREKVERFKHFYLKDLFVLTQDVDLTGRYSK